MLCELGGFTDFPSRSLPLIAEQSVSSPATKMAPPPGPYSGTSTLALVLISLKFSLVFCLFVPDLTNFLFDFIFWEKDEKFVDFGPIL